MGGIKTQHEDHYKVDSKDNRFYHLLNSLMVSTRLFASVSLPVSSLLFILIDFIITIVKSEIKLYKKFKDCQ